MSEYLAALVILPVITLMVWSPVLFSIMILISVYDFFKERDLRKTYDWSKHLNDAGDPL